MKQKNTTTRAKASPESSAADKVIVYFDHQAYARFRMTWLNMKQTTAQTEKFRPVAGGIQLRLPNRTGKLTFRQKLFLCLLPSMNTIIGAIAPTKKAQTSGRYKAPEPKKRCGPTTPHNMLPLKWTRAIGQLKPLIASAVQIPGM